MTLLSLRPSFSLYFVGVISLLPEGNFYEDQSVVWGLLETHPNTSFYWNKDSSHNDPKVTLYIPTETPCEFLWDWV